jgi:hypothetical protein
MDVERIIDDIEQLQEMFEAPDIRPLSASDTFPAGDRHRRCFQFLSQFSLAESQFSANGFDCSSPFGKDGFGLVPNGNHQ